MRIEGNEFNFFVNGESKTCNEAEQLYKSNMNMTICGLDVYYVSPKKSEIAKESKTEKLLKGVEQHQNQNGGILQGVEFPFDYTPLKTGRKESEGKLFYELDFEFVKQMAERMQSNKDNSKYEKWNWKRPMTHKGLEDLKQAMWRHIMAVMQGEFEDDGREFGHLEAISNNAMMINYQLKNK